MNLNMHSRWKMAALTLLTGALALVWMSPFYLVFVNSLKDFGSVIKSPLSLPDPTETSNYSIAWETSDFANAFLNSAFVTVLSVTGLVLIGSLASWRIARVPHRTHKAIYFAFVAAMVVPFQTVMIPMVQVAAQLHLLNSRVGLVVLYLSFGIPLTVFFLHGFVRSSVPISLEEAAQIDGATQFQIFRYVVFPILRPMIATVSILHIFWIWNDFLLPLLVLFDPQKRTIPLAIFSFLGVHTDQWNLALATLAMGMIPIVIFFLIFQRFIIRGVAAGSLKG